MREESCSVTADALRARKPDYVLTSDGRLRLTFIGTLLAVIFGLYRRFLGI